MYENWPPHANFLRTALAFSSRLHPQETTLHHIPVSSWKHSSLPLWTSSLYTLSRPLRSASRSFLQVSRPRDYKTKLYTQQAFRYVAPYLWNALPEGMREDDSVQSFKASLKTLFWKLTYLTFTKISSVMMLILAVDVMIVLMLHMHACVCTCVGV